MNTMVRFTQKEVIKKLGDTRYMPLLDFANAKVCKHVLKTSYNAGMRRVFELTNRDTMTQEVFRQIAPFIEKECSELSFGAGTVLDEETDLAFMGASADFIVAPVFDKGTATACKKRAVPYIPDCLTPSEMYNA
jgi:2-dehydro-3-deoxyphosphogluconate aldolase/(4S)-4-hydroxy-2-oxoglutarate aldolase